MLPRLLTSVLARVLPVSLFAVSVVAVAVDVCCIGLRADDFDLYYLGGQSNMEGFGSNRELSESERQEVEGAWIYQPTPVPDQQPATGVGKWAPVEPGHGTGFSSDGQTNRLSDRFGVELSFARAMRQRRPDRRIAIIKYARNGSSIDARAAGNWGCWEPDFTAATGLHREINQYDQFLAAVDAALAAGDIDGDGTPDRLIPRGIVWMQGESDAVHGDEIASGYAANLKRLMDLIRAAFRTDDLPVVIGRISDSRRGTDNPVWKSGDIVRSQQMEFASADRAARVVVDTDLYSYSDPYHYDSAGYLDLGGRFANALLSIPHGLPLSMFEEGASLKVESGDGAGGEGPAWDSELGVLSSGNGNIHRLAPDGTVSVFRADAGTNGLLFDSDGRLICCEPRLRRVTRLARDGTLSVLTERFDGKRYNQPNDVTVDSKGRIYFSDPRYGERDSMEIRDENGQTIEGVYRIDPDGSVHRVLGREVNRANGVLVSADDRYLFVADNNNNTEDVPRVLWRFELQADGAVKAGSGVVLFDWGRGRGPDGLKQDAAGNLYVAGGLNRSNPPFESDPTFRGGIYVLSPDGVLLDFLPVPTDEVTNCAFGGPDNRTLYITGGGVLYSIRTLQPGHRVSRRHP
ncbi:MAG: SMP-30/gluconolactonase/LRE family protein [Planctomycetaceae bacterium]|nr:SMP-30/gluconolactonase/LRE family protein [Planctomycetaceae bacterium]